MPAVVLSSRLKSGLHEGRGRRGAALLRLIMPRADIQLSCLPARSMQLMTGSVRVASR